MTVARGPPLRCAGLYATLRKDAVHAEIASKYLPNIEWLSMSSNSRLSTGGVRCGETLGLKWQDVDVAGKELHITRAIYRGRETTPKTRASLRSRPIVKELASALVDHKVIAHYTADSDYVFASNSGRPLNPDILRKHLQAALKQMDVALPARTDGLHLLRHSSTSNRVPAHRRRSQSDAGVGGP